MSEPERKILYKFLCTECGWTARQTISYYRSPCPVCKGNVVNAAHVIITLPIKEKKGGNADAGKSGNVGKRGND